MTAHGADTGALSGRYRDLVDIGHGSEGTRYSGRLHDGAHVTVWLLSRELASRITAPDRFIDMLGRVAEIRHAGLARLLSFGCAADGLLHCAYAVAPSSRIAPGLSSPADLARAGAQLARALAVMHDSGILHGGISTDRISAHGGSAVLEGAGLHPALVAGGLSRSEAAVALSFAPYRSPELQNGGEPDERSDVYALGASLYELLTGKPPFGGRTTSYVMASVLSGDAAEPGAAGSNTAVPSGPAVDAILRAIERSPDDRWPSADAFALALDGGASPPRAKPKSFFAILKDEWFPARRSRE